MIRPNDLNVPDEAERVFRLNGQGWANDLTAGHRHRGARGGSILPFLAQNLATLIVNYLNIKGIASLMSGSESGKF